MWIPRQTLFREPFGNQGPCGKETNSFPQSHRGTLLYRVFHRNITDNAEVGLPESGACPVSHSPYEILDLDLEAWLGPDFVFDLLDGVHHRRVVPSAELHAHLCG